MSPEKWRLKRKGEDFFRVLDAPPIAIYVVIRKDPPGHPGQSEIAENPDGSLKAYPNEETAIRVAAEMGAPWKSSLMLFAGTEPGPAPIPRIAPDMDVQDEPTFQATAQPEASPDTESATQQKCTCLSPGPLDKGPCRVHRSSLTKGENL